MTSLASTRPFVDVRIATPEDNDALRAVAASCSMDGDMSLRLTREPDFFQLNRLEGSRWRVGVAEFDGQVVGSAMAAERRAYLHGREQTTLYAGDLKVHPLWRRLGVGDALSEWVRSTLEEMGGGDAPVLLTVLGGNRAMASRILGRGNVPAFEYFATIRAISIPLIFPCARADTTYRITAATPADIGEMVALWRRVAPTRQFAPVLDEDDLACWISSAPGLDISSYRLARNARGRLVGFMAWWDQSELKQLHVRRYSPRLAAARTLLNGAARLTGGVPLPGPGEPLRYCTAVHVCVPADSPATLRALLRATHPELRAARYACATVGLDARDPLIAALGGLFGQPTDVGAYICTPTGRYAGPPLADRPLHYEVALV